MTPPNKSLPIALFGLRANVFLVMSMWTPGKFTNPAHAAKVYESFYFIGGLESSAMRIVGIMELIVLAAFLVGWHKKFSYGFVLAPHAVSTPPAFRYYLPPFESPHCCSLPPALPYSCLGTKMPC